MSFATSIGSSRTAALAAAWCALSMVRAALAMHVQEEGLPADQSHKSRPLPNIVLILADSLRPDFIGAYGNRAFAQYGVTPNLDRLATEGAVFHQAFATASLSAPSRFSIVTGHYSSHKPADGQHLSLSQLGPQSGQEEAAEQAAQEADTAKYQVPKSGLIDHAVAEHYCNRTMGARLRQRGYVTAGIGKWHLGSEMHRDTFNFSYLMAGNPEDSQAWGIAPGSPSQNPEELTWQAEKFVRAATRTGEPFFLHLAHTIPHGSYNMSKVLREDPGTGQEPFLDSAAPRNEHGLRTLQMNERQQSFIQKSRADLRDALMMRGLIRDAFKDNTKHAGSLGALMWLDQQVGQLLQALHRADVLDNTLVIFTADRGMVDPNGAGTDHPLNMGSRVPLLVRWTNGGVVPGIHVQEPVSLVDLMPTILHAGQASAGGRDMDGLDLLPAIRGLVGTWHTHPENKEGRYPGDILDRLHNRPVWLESGAKRAVVKEAAQS